MYEGRSFDHPDSQLKITLVYILTHSEVVGGGSELSLNSYLDVTLTYSCLFLMWAHY